MLGLQSKFGLHPGSATRFVYIRMYMPYRLHSKHKAFVGLSERHENYCSYPEIVWRPCSLCPKGSEFDDLSR